MLTVPYRAPDTPSKSERFHCIFTRIYLCKIILRVGELLVLYAETPVTVLEPAMYTPVEEHLLFRYPEDYILTILIVLTGILYKSSAL